MNREEFIGASLGLNLFWARIMKEHCIFLAAGLPCKEMKATQNLDRFKVQFEMLLHDVIELSGSLPGYVAESGAFVTDFTESAEQKTMDLAGVSINTRLTALERSLLKNPRPLPVGKLPAVYETARNINAKAAAAAGMLYELQNKLLDGILSGETFSANYPSVYMHMNDEAADYIENLGKLSVNESINADVCEYGVFWNRNLMQHAATVRGMLDPAETGLFEKADRFALGFGALNDELKGACGAGRRGARGGADITAAADRAVGLTGDIKRYHSEMTHSIMINGVKSVILPLLSDHMLRETNYYLLLLPA